MFVLTPHEEAFGNVFAEALASGLPVIGSNIGAIPELVENGENGILVPPGDSAAIALAVRELGDDPARRAAIALAESRTGGDDAVVGRGRRPIPLALRASCSAQDARSRAAPAMIGSTRHSRTGSRATRAPRARARSRARCRCARSRRGRLRALLVLTRNAHRSSRSACAPRDSRRPGALRDAELPLALQSLAPVSKHDMREAGHAALRDGRVSAFVVLVALLGLVRRAVPRVLRRARVVDAQVSRESTIPPRGRHALDRLASRSSTRFRRRAKGARRSSAPGACAASASFARPPRSRRMLAAYRPAAVYGLPSALLEIAHAIESGAPPVRTSRIFTSGELLTGSARRSIAAAFGASLYDVLRNVRDEGDRLGVRGRLASCERGCRSRRDPRRSRRPVPAGTEGEIVVTLLVNRAMPLVRYRTGDRGALLPAACSCGRATPLLGVVERARRRRRSSFRTAPRARRIN